MIIAKVLTTLPEDYRYFASAWEQREKTLENLTARLIAEETRNKSKEPEEKAVTFKAADKKCYKCNKSGHFARNCTRASKGSDRYVASNVIKWDMLLSRVEKNKNEANTDAAFARKLTTVIRIVFSKIKIKLTKMKIE